MPRKRIVLVDLDNTLIDTEKLKSRFFALIRRFGVPRVLAKKAYYARKGNFAPESYLRRLIKEKRQREAVLRKYRELNRVGEKYNFDGAFVFLRKLSGKYRLILLTCGHRPHQLMKLRRAGFGDFFNKIVVTNNPRKSRELAKFYKLHGKEVLIIDDSPDVCLFARKLGMSVIKVRRGRKDAEYYGRLSEKIREIFNKQKSRQNYWQKSRNR